MFGRKDDGGGLAGLGGGTTVAGLPTVRAAEDPSPAPRPEWPLVLVMTLIAVAGAWGLIARDWGVYDEPARRPVAGGFPIPELPATSPAAEGPFTSPDRFAQALGTIRDRSGAGARAVLMRVDAGQVWTVLSLPDGGRRVITLRGDRVSDVASAGGAVEGVPLEEIDARAPRRLLDGLERRFGVQSGEVEYVVLAHFPAPGRWSAFLHGGAHFSADLSGRRAVRIG